LLLGDAPFARFLAFSDWLFDTTGQTHRIALDRLYTLVFDGITTIFDLSPDTAREVLSRDYYESGARGAPKFLTGAKLASTAVSVQGNARRQARSRREVLS
jgi:hypothetical protein